MVNSRAGVPVPIFSGLASDFGKSDCNARIFLAVWSYVVLLSQLCSFWYLLQHRRSWWMKLLNAFTWS